MICLIGDLFGAADVAHGCFGVRVAEELLDDQEWRFVDSHVGAYGVADGVRRDRLCDVGGTDVFFDYVADRARR